MTRHPTVLIGCFAALVLGACATTNTKDKLATPPEVEVPIYTSPVSGSIIYRERIALTPNAVVQVQVVELRDQGEPEPVVAQLTLRNPGQVPIPFTVEVPSERIDPNAAYMLQATISDTGRVFTTTEPVPVLTKGYASQDVRVVVHPGR